MSPVKVFQAARASVRAYTSSAKTESWKKEHPIAMECLALEGMIRNGLAAYDTLAAVDSDWRDMVLSGQASFDPKFHESLEDLFRKWLEPVPGIEKAIRFFRGKGYDVKGSNTLLRRVAEVQWMLQDPSTLFKRAEFTSLRDEAMILIALGRSLTEPADEVTSRRTWAFRQVQARLGQSDRNKLDGLFNLFRSDPKHPFLRIKPVTDSRSGRHRRGSFALTIRWGLRALYVVDGGEYIWYWLGTHEAYNNFIGSK